MRDGDHIRIDIPARKLELVGVSDNEIKRRLEKVKVVDRHPDGHAGQVPEAGQRCERRCDLQVNAGSGPLRPWAKRGSEFLIRTGTQKPIYSPGRLRPLIGRLDQTGRSPALQAGGRAFKSRTVHFSYLSARTQFHRCTFIDRVASIVQCLR